MNIKTRSFLSIRISGENLFNWKTSDAEATNRTVNFVRFPLKSDN